MGCACVNTKSPFKLTALPENPTTGIISCSKFILNPSNPSNMTFNNEYNNPNGSNATCGWNSNKITVIYEIVCDKQLKADYRKVDMIFANMGSEDSERRVTPRFIC